MRSKARSSPVYLPFKMESKDKAAAKNPKAVIPTMEYINLILLFIR